MSIKEFVKEFNSINGQHSHAETLELVDDLCDRLKMTSVDIHNVMDTGIDDDFSVLRTKYLEIKEYELKKLKRKESINRVNLYESEETDKISWNSLLLDMKRDFGEFTAIKGKDFKYISKWLENKISNKSIIK